MKKKWFYLAASVILAGCAEDAFDNGLLQDTEIPQEIKLSVGTARAEVTTRGAGSIGDTIQSSNVWSGQNLIIWAFHKKASSLAINDAQNVYLRGDSAVADGDNNVVTLTWKDKASRYYPLQGAFHFAGYYIDDAADGAANQTESSIVQNVTIDGSQDIMIAQAELKSDDKKKLINSLIDYGKLTGSVGNYLNTSDSILSHKDTILAEYAKAYSSYTARREIQPNMIFKHQLARLKFSVTAGDDNSVGGQSQSIEFNDSITKNLAPGVLIQSIKLKKAQTKGIITMALPTTDNDPIITFTPTLGEKSGVLTLQEKKDGNTTLTELTPKAPTSKTAYTPIGESILAFPEDKYLIDVETIQYLQKKDDAYEAVKDSTGIINTYQDVTIELMKDENGQPVQFKAGYTYDIKVKVYSNQEISITATLEGWKPGGDIVISPEDDIFDQDHNSSNNAGNN